MNMKKKDFLSGFTLIELMVVITIIGILLILLLPRITLVMDRSREKTTYKNLKGIKLAVDIYSERPDGGYDYPTTADQLKEILNKKFDNQIPRAVLRISSGVSASNECYLAESTAFIPVAPEGGWVFITSGGNRGDVFINSTVLDTNKNSYTTYLCW